MKKLHKNTRKQPVKKIQDDKDNAIEAIVAPEPTIPAFDPSPAPVAQAAATEAPAAAVVESSGGNSLKYILGGLLVLGGGIAAASGGGGGGSSGGNAPAPTNTNPVANNDTVTTDEDNTITISVLTNDTDADNDKLTVTAATANHGTVTINANGTLAYTPTANYNGTDIINYSISDGKGGASSATVAVTVTAAPAPAKLTGVLIDSPVGGVDYYINGENKGKTDSDGSFTYVEGDKVTFKIGNIVLAENITPNADHIVYLQDLAGIPRDQAVADNALVIKLAQLLQSLDSNNNPNDGISVDPTRLKSGQSLNITADTDVASLLNTGVALVAPVDALDHLNNNSPQLRDNDNIKPAVKDIIISDTALKAGETAVVTITFTENIKAFGDIVTAENGTLTPVPASLPANQLQYTFTPNKDISDTSNVIKVSDNYVDMMGNKGMAMESKNYAIDTQGYSADEVFAMVGQNQNIGDTGGFYRTLFELAAASYVHPDSMGDISAMKNPTVAGEKSENLKLNSLEHLSQYIDFDLSAEELNLTIGLNNSDMFGGYSVAYENGFFVAYNDDGVDTSSVALVGRVEDAIYIGFRGSNVGGDFLEDAGILAVGMEQHYERFKSLFAGVEQYAKTNNIAKIYVGGHSLGGEMATMFMQEHADNSITTTDGQKIKYESVTFEAANKALGDKLVDSRSVNFEMRGDIVPDLGYFSNEASFSTNIYDTHPNYGKSVFLDYEKDYVKNNIAMTIEPHFMGNLNDQINQVFKVLPSLGALEEMQRYYTDDQSFFDGRSDGVIVTNFSYWDDPKNLPLRSTLHEVTFIGAPALRGGSVPLNNNFQFISDKFTV